MKQYEFSRGTDEWVVTYNDCGDIEYVTLNDNDVEFDVIGFIDSDDTELAVNIVDEYEETLHGFVFIFEDDMIVDVRYVYGTDYDEEDD